MLRQNEIYTLLHLQVLSLKKPSVLLVRFSFKTQHGFIKKMKEIYCLIHVFLRDHVRATWQLCRQSLCQIKITNNQLILLSLVFISIGIGGAISGIVWVLDLWSFLFY